jgi:hypothetical protein
MAAMRCAIVALGTPSVAAISTGESPATRIARIALSAGSSLAAASAFICGEIRGIVRGLRATARIASTRVAAAAGFADDRVGAGDGSRDDQCGGGVRGEEDDGRRVGLALDPKAQRQSIASGVVEIEDDDCWVGALEQWPELVLVGGEADHLQVGLRREDGLQPSADRGMVI